MLALTTGLGLGWLGMYAYFNGKFDSLTSRSQAALVANLEIRTEMLLQEAIDGSVIERALILKLHNGGGKLYMGIPKYTTVLHERIVPDIRHSKPDFQYYPIDHEYMLLMQRILTEEVVVLITSEMPEEMLKRRYEADGITVSVVFTISETDAGLYYGSFSTRGDANEFLSNVNYSSIETFIHRLRLKFKEAKQQQVLH